jgi:hypothetical protein
MARSRLRRLCSRRCGLSRRSVLARVSWAPFLGDALVVVVGLLVLVLFVHVLWVPFAIRSARLLLDTAEHEVLISEVADYEFRR